MVTTFLIYGQYSLLQMKKVKGEAVIVKVPFKKSWTKIESSKWLKL